MSRLNKRSIVYIPVVILSLAAVYFLIPGLFSNPSGVFTAFGGDGSKNAYVPFYYALYDQGLHFTGMNYPYGDHLVFPDGQPLLAAVFRWLHVHYRLNTEGMLAIMNIYMGLHIALCMMLLFAILRKYNTHPLWAGIAALFIAFMCPQILRITGHFGLSYMSFVPLMLLLLLNHSKKPAFRQYVYISLAVIFYCLFHMYYAALALVMCGAYALYNIIHGRFRKKVVLQHIGIILSVGLAVIALQIVIAVTDNVTDRPQIPWGVLSAITRARDLHSNDCSPIWKALHEHGMVKKLASSGSEGNAYTGIAAIVLIIIGIVLYIAGRAKKQRAPNQMFAGATLPPGILFAAFICLIIALGIPFAWNMEWLFAKLPGFRQFRALGRFSWVFYYIVSLQAALWLPRLFLLAKGGTGKIALKIVSCLLFAVWLTEVNGYWILFRHESGSWDEYKAFLLDDERNEYAQLRANVGKGLDSIGCITVLPFVHIGTEKMGRQYEGETWSMAMTFKGALQLSLPIRDVMMARCSWSQAADQLHILGGPYSPKTAMHAGPRSNELLFCVSGKPLSPGEQYLYQFARPAGAVKDMTVAVLDVNRLLEYEDSLRQEARRIAAALPAGTVKGQCFYEHFHQAKGPASFLGMGALGEQTIPEPDILRFKVSDSLPCNAVYELSFWMQPTAHDYSVSNFIVAFLDSNNQWLKEIKIPGKELTNHVGLWWRESAYFIMPERTAIITIKGRDGHVPVIMGLDEILLRPEHETVYYKSPEGKLMVNNHPL